MHRIKTLGLLALPIIAVVLALMVFSFGNSSTDTAEATGPSQSLSATGNVICSPGDPVPEKPLKCFAASIPGWEKAATEFQITLSANDVPAISGWGGEVLFGGLTWNPGAECEDDVDLPGILCVRAIALGGTVARVGGINGFGPTVFPALPGTPGGSVQLAHFNVHCAGPGTFKVTATDHPTSLAGAIFKSAPDGNTIPVVGSKTQDQTNPADPVGAGTPTPTPDVKEVADTLLINCVDQPTPTATPTATSTSTATPTLTPPPVPFWQKQDVELGEADDPPGDNLSNLFLTAQGAKIPPIRCEDSTDSTTFREVLSRSIVSPDPKGFEEFQVLGAFEFEVRYDPKLVCVNLTRGEAAAHMICVTDDKDDGIAFEGLARMGCVTLGKDVTPPALDVFGKGHVLAYLTVQPQPDLYVQLRANQDNGINANLLDQNCQLADEQGHTIPIFNCEDGQVTIRYLEGDVVPDCDVTALDQQAIAFRWGAQKGSLLYNDRFDLEPSGFAAGGVSGDGDVDIGDLQFVFGRHGSSCAVPHPKQAPVNANELPPTPPIPFS